MMFVKVNMEDGGYIFVGLNRNTPQDGLLNIFLFDSE